MTVHAFTPTPDDPTGDRTAPLALFSDSRWTGDRGAGRWVPDTVAANAMPDPPPEPDPVRRLRGLVAIVVNPMMYDYQQGFLSYASVADFCADTIRGVREYAAEMDFDIEAAEAEARRQLEGSYGRDICRIQ